MSKAQTDIRTTSYDELAARPDGYQGSIDSVIAQIRGEGGYQSRPTWPGQARYDLLQFLNVPQALSKGPSVELDQDVRYGAPEAPSKAQEPGFYTLEYAMKHWPWNFKLPGSPGSSNSGGTKP